MSPKTRNPILAALVAGLSVSLVAPMAMAQGPNAQNCILLPDGTRQCTGTGPQAPQGQPGAQQPAGWMPQGQPGQGQPPQFGQQQGQPGQGQPPRMGQQGQPPQVPGGFTRQGQPQQGQPGQPPQFGQQGQPGQGQPGQGPGTYAHQGQPPRLGQQGQPPQGPGGFAQQGQPQQGQPGQQPQFGQQGQPGQGPGGFAQMPGNAPQIGNSARRAPVFQQAMHSRLPPPPAHQHYRVVDGTIVRVDDTTLQIVAIVGLLSAILNSN